MTKRASWMVIFVLLLASAGYASDPPPVSFQSKKDQLEVLIDGQPLATYVYRDIVTAAGSVLSKCRDQSEPGADPADVRLRTLGVCQVGSAGSTLADSAVEILSRSVVERWNVAV